MKQITLLVLFILFFSITTIQAQDTRPWDVYFSQMSTFEDMESEEWQDYYELLCELEEHPININNASWDDLQHIPFLDHQQIDDILSYIQQYGGMQSAGELAMIKLIDYNTRCLLSFFIRFEIEKEKKFPSLQQITKYGQNELLLTGNVPFYERRGDQEIYLGYQYRHSLRYQFHYSDYLKIGLSGSQDAGEPFFADKNKWGYDNYSFYMQIHRLGRLKSLHIGRYRASFGMGLVINNDFSMGKIASLSKLGNTTYGFRAHTSRSVANYLQGAAATVSMTKELDLSTFVSYRKVDATLNKTDSTVSSIVTNGYHRTPTEMAKKNNTSEITAGTHIHYFKNGWHGGATASYTSYSRDLKPNTSQSYRMYYPAGNDFWNVSVDYGYTSHLLNIQGETATGDCHDIATIHVISVTPYPTLSLMAVHRYYGKKYYAMHAKSFSEGGRVQNENGFYVGAKWQSMRHWQLTAYSDYAYFTAPKYQAKISSRAWDNLVQAQYTTDQISFTARYRLKMRQYDNQEKTALIDKIAQKAHAGVSFKQRQWTFSTQADLTHTDFDNQSLGWMLCEYVTFSHHQLRVSANIGYFNTDDTESSIYSYDQGTLYQFAFQSYSGEGIKYGLFARLDISQRLMLIAHLSTIDYFDRNHISSGYQQINHSSKTDLEMQIRWKF